jgi:hypothetical protein
MTDTDFAAGGELMGNYDVVQKQRNLAQHNRDGRNSRIFSPPSDCAVQHILMFTNSAENVNIDQRGLNDSCSDAYIGLAV